MKLYHFLPERWALQALKDQRIKVSTYDSLNDPFELMAMDVRDKNLRKFIKEVKEKNNKMLRLLCCSREWKSPLLWAHYADRHKGIALELEVPANHTKEINYVPNREKIDLRTMMKRSEENKQAWFELSSTKYDQWQYEDELRIQFLAEDVTESNSLYFVPFSETLKLTSLILGSMNNINDSKLLNFLPMNSKIKVLRARPAFGSFDIVPDKSKPAYELSNCG